MIPVKKDLPRRVQYAAESEVPVLDRPEDDVSRETYVERVLPTPKSTPIFVIANQKGGVGKTTTAVNLAAGLAAGGLKVLVIDVDPQGNASTALGVEHDMGTRGTYEVMLERTPIAEVMKRSTEPGEIWVVPATIDLAAAELELVNEQARETRLKSAIRQHLAEHRVDYILFDCPPSLGLLTLNALVAASDILIPIQCEYYALEGVTQLMRTINLVKGSLNDDLVLGAVLLTMYDGRTRLAREVATEVRRHFSKEVLDAVIPRSVRVSEAPSYASSVLSYEPNSTGAAAYRQAAEELAARYS